MPKRGSIPLIARDSELTAGLATKANTSHPHSGADITTGTVAEAWIDPLIARDSELTAGLATKANTSHPHSGTDITTGTVAEAWIDPAIARDSEVMNIVKENDGAGSGVDADLLDGQHASNFATTSHTQPFSSITGTATDAQIPDYITIEYAKSADVCNQCHQCQLCGKCRQCSQRRYGRWNACFKICHHQSQP